MLLKCDVIVSNRLAPARTDSRKCHATFVLGKQKKKNQQEEVTFTLFTTKNKVGVKYKVVENILKVHTCFIKDGLCTITMKDPPHDLAVSKADVGTLKKFLHVLRVVLKKEDTSNIAELVNVLKVKNSDLEKPRAKLSILCRADYPLKTGFPSSLETLTVNDCSLQKFDNRILKLRFLITLDLSRNKLKSLCSSLESLVNIRCLLLSENQFETVPLCITQGEISHRLTYLDLSSNRISYLPASVSSLTELHTLKANDNSIISIPHTFGWMKNLRRLELSQNLITCLPWSFSKLKLDYLDLSCNRFYEMNVGLLGNHIDESQIPNPPSLFEICSRKIICENIRFRDGKTLPRQIRSLLANARYCQCGEPCIKEHVPIVCSFNAGRVTQTLAYELEKKQQLKLMTSLCSLNCYRTFVDDPRFSKKMNVIM